MKRRGFLGMLFGAPAVVAAGKLSASEKFKETARKLDLAPVVEVRDDWEPEDAYCDVVATCVPVSRLNTSNWYKTRAR